MLVERARLGDAVAYAGLVERYQDIAFRVAFITLGSAADPGSLNHFRTSMTGAVANYGVRHTSRLPWIDAREAIKCHRRIFAVFRF